MDKKPINLTGKFTPFWEDNSPIFMKIFESEFGDATFIVVYSTLEKLRDAMEHQNIQDYKIKHIDNGRGFATSVVEGGFRIMLDPYVVDGKVKWTEVVLP